MASEALAERSSGFLVVDPFPFFGVCATAAPPSQPPVVEEEFPDAVESMTAMTSFSAQSRAARRMHGRRVCGLPSAEVLAKADEGGTVASGVTSNLQ